MLEKYLRATSSLWDKRCLLMWKSGCVRHRVQGEFEFSGCHALTWCSYSPQTERSGWAAGLELRPPDWTADFHLNSVYPGDAILPGLNKEGRQTQIIMLFISLLLHYWQCDWPLRLLMLLLFRESSSSFRQLSIPSTLEMLLSLKEAQRRFSSLFKLESLEIPWLSRFSVVIWWKHFTTTEKYKNAKMPNRFNCAKISWSICEIHIFHKFTHISSRALCYWKPHVL